MEWCDRHGTHPSRLEQTGDLITAHAGLLLLGEVAIGLGLVEAVDKSLSAAGSGAGYRAGEHVLPLAGKIVFSWAQYLVESSPAGARAVCRDPSPQLGVCQQLELSEADFGSFLTMSSLSEK